MNKKLTIKFGKYNIIAEIMDMNEPEIPPELCIYLADDEDYVIQDICLVRPHYEIDQKTYKFKRDDNYLDCLVWGESENENYTDKHVIMVREEEDEE